MSRAFRLVVTIGVAVASRGALLEATTPEPKEPKAAKERGVERIVLLGNTFIERAARYGYLETALVNGWPRRGEAAVEFRNLGWSGDTVFGHARSYFGPPKEGFSRLQKHIRRLRPTHVVVYYGAVAAFQGPDGVEEFRGGLERLVDMLQGSGAEVFLATPLPHESLGEPFPDPQLQNKNLELYAQVIREVGKRQKLRVIPLGSVVSETLRRFPEQRFTDNGVHLTDFGYWALASRLAGALGAELPDWLVDVNVLTKQATAAGATVQELRAKGGKISFRVRDQVLPSPPPPRHSPRAAWSTEGRRRTLRIRGLAAGRYTLSVDGEQVAEADATAWGAGVRLTRGPEFEQAERLRRKVTQKNELYFHRWRPQNETYLFGFRRHEQGEHAAEVPKFDPLVAEAEKEIATLREPFDHRYELCRKN